MTNGKNVIISLSLSLALSIETLFVKRRKRELENKNTIALHCHNTRAVYTKSYAVLQVVVLYRFINKQISPRSAPRTGDTHAVKYYDLI